MKLTISSIFFAFIIFILLTSCSKTELVPIDNSNKTESTKAEVTPAAQRVAVTEAEINQCKNGGFIYKIYSDVNSNNELDNDETVLSQQIVCNGVNGHGVAFKLNIAPIEICPNGGTVLLIASDINDDGVFDPTAPAQQSISTCNGQNGANAPTSSYSVVEPIVPCGNTVAYKEILLRLQSGQVLASVSNDTSGSMTRLAFLPDGTYMNTDSSNCTFSLSTSLDGNSRSISWQGQVQKSWAIIN